MSAMMGRQTDQTGVRSRLRSLGRVECAKVAGHQAPINSTLISSTLVREQFWEEQSGAVVEEFTRDWQPFAWRNESLT